MGEIQKRAHQLKKQQEAQSALKSKIKVSGFRKTIAKVEFIGKKRDLIAG